MRSLSIPLLAFCLGATHAQVPAPATPVPASATLLVFSDFECPFSAETFRELHHLQTSGAAKFQVIYKQTPLPVHPGAQIDALAALAARRQGRYDAMANLLYANQTTKSEDQLVSYAHQLGLNEAQFRRDLKSASVRAELDADMAESAALGIEQTPTLYVQGKKLVGVQSSANLTALFKDSSAQLANSTPISLPPSQLSPAQIAALQAKAPNAKGYDAAPVTIVEFTDFQCPFCRAAVEPMEQLIAARGHQVRWVFRSYPLEFHPNAEPAAEAAFAAGAQGKFWPMHDLLFANQTALQPDDLRRYAAQLHLDMAKFDEAMRTHRYAGEVAADRALGQTAQVTGTPTFLVNGVAVSGVRSLPELEQIVDTAVSRPGFAAPPTVVTAESASPTDRPVYGPASGAPLLITWYTDVRSPLAGRQAELIRTLTHHYDGHVSVLYKAFPLGAHADSKLAAAALLAAQKQDAFWPMYDALSDENGPLDQSKLLSLAVKLHMNTTAFLAALDAAPPDITSDMDEAMRRGIQGAPVIFLNDARVDGLQREGFYFDIADRILASKTTTAVNSVSH